MARGRLKVEVYTGEQAKPVIGATVSIVDTEDKIIEQVVTDINGHTPELILDAPALDFSERPSSTRPYSEYVVRVNAEGFSTILIKNVQIFANSLAIQEANIEAIQNIKEQNITIDDNTLWGSYPPKTPESETKPVGDETGFVVLDKPVIPEYIVVHDGKPNDNATNYWIPFKSYIKNVACSEIYSTWPTETIKANVLAIISFTLNRVYTEWYRSKGYYYTITSQTAYDQHFKYGRTIYSSISKIVDEVFATYISKTTLRQPILAQYCDGEKTKCPNGLSQWGSKYLGDRGLSAIEILRNYYGNSIILKQADEISGIAISYPGRLLSVGSRGADVKTLQAQLTGINKNFPGIPALVADGIFGPATRRSVEAFQTAFNLTVDGIVGYATWYKVSQIYVAVEKLNT